MAMKTMYPGVANSPETFLQYALTADGTIMYLADGSVLGTLPTYAVIGGSASAETVLVTSQAEDGGYNIQRAVEGVAIAWPQATLVARNFTNADYAALVGNVTELNVFKEEVQDTLDSMSEDLANVQQTQATKDAEQDASIAACALKTEIPTIVNDLSTGGETAALSAEQGKVLLNQTTENASMIYNAIQAVQKKVENLVTLSNIVRLEESPTFYSTAATETITITESSGYFSGMILLSNNPAEIKVFLDDEQILVARHEYTGDDWHYFHVAPENLLYLYPLNPNAKDTTWNIWPKYWLDTDLGFVEGGSINQCGTFSTAVNWSSNGGACLLPCPLRYESSIKIEMTISDLEGTNSGYVFYSPDPQ